MSHPLLLRSILTASAVLTLALAGATDVSAQSTPPPKPSAPAAEVRPAFTTFFGDTGLWFVPTAEVLPAGKLSVSGYRRGTNYEQGYTNVGDFATTIAVGVRDRAEIFASFLVDTRIDRDTKPLFFNDAAVGGIVARYPNVTTKWSGNNLGDFYIGAKVNLLSQSGNRPLAFALRGLVKMPTGKKSAGVSTGKFDTSIDAVASKELGRAVELSGFAGYEFRGNPEGFDLPTGAVRWGVGAGFPSRYRLRLVTELSGMLPSSDSALITSATVIGEDLSRPPARSNTEKLTRLTAGLNYQAKNGFFVGLGLSRNLPSIKRNLSRSSEGSFTDYTDWQLRIGFHPGVRAYVAPMPVAPIMPEPPPPVAAPPPPPPPPAHTLTVKASCDLCTVEVNKVATVTATVTDSVNCAVSYLWSAPSGAVTSTTSRVTPWTAPSQPGTVPVTVTVTCPDDRMTASDTVNILVTRAEIKAYAFDDVYFEFDRSTLRPDALRVLDQAIAAMKQDATLNLTIEGNTCNIGTAEYNLALGERRAATVRDYLVTQGVSASRLRTLSYGEERPKFDNDREETRRLNRRAVLVVRLER